MSSVEHSIESACLFGKQRLLDDFESALLDAEWLLCGVLNVDQTYLRTWPERLVTADDMVKFTDHLDRRLKGEPIAYILGYQYFWGLRLKVSPAVLVPRADTETLVEAVLKICSSQNKLNCLDLGTGSGAIALALASECAHWDILAVDISESALLIAIENRDFYQLKNVTLLQSNWYGDIDSTMTFDVITSNPPYIAQNDPFLCENVKQHEPLLALLSDSGGLKDIELIISGAKHQLNLNGYLFIEHGFQQGKEVNLLFEKYGFINIEHADDLSGHCRVTYAKIGNND